MAFCRKCGNKLKKDQEFCPQCGEAVGASTVAPASAPAAAPGPEAASVVAAVQKRWKSRKPLWIGLVTLVVLIVVACVLVFAVFHDQIFGGGTSGPEQKVQEAITAMEHRDVNALYALLDPNGVEYLHQTQQMDPNALKTALGQGLTAFDSISYSDVQMKTVMESGGTKATVTLVGGKMTTVKSGQSTVDDLKTSAQPQKFYVILRSGKWYLDIVRMTQVSSMTP